MASRLETLFQEYQRLGIDQQLDYDKFYLYSLVTHSTAIEGSTITEIENQILFDHGISLKGKSLIEQSMNLDLKAAYEKAIELAKAHTAITVQELIALAAIVMKNTGSDYSTALGSFSSSRSELRLLNVSAGIGGRSYMSFTKVPLKLGKLCEDINKTRANLSNLSISERYAFSFDAHFHLVTIHPWADGNGRMARLLMNLLQFEADLIPTKIQKADKEDYIKALEATREKNDLSIFRRFMSEMMEKQLEREIAEFKQSVGEDEDGVLSMNTTKKKLSTKERILERLQMDNTLTASALAIEFGLSLGAINKQITLLKREGKLLRIGPPKGGHWEIP